MKSSKSLTIGMTIFCFFVFVSFGVIIVTEKASVLMIPKIEKKLTKYLETEYKDIKNELKTNQTIYKNTEFKMKVESKQNKNLYFTITYSNKKITDDYEKNFVKGETFLKYISKQIDNNIKIKTNKNYSITINTTLDKFSSKVKEKLLSENSLESLKIYTLETELTTKSWNETQISKIISDFINSLEEKNITPKNYILIITDKEDITKSVKISNITKDIIENNTINLIISDIINNRKDNIDKTNITYEYLN